MKKTFFFSPTKLLRSSVMSIFVFELLFNAIFPFGIPKVEAASTASCTLDIAPNISSFSGEGIQFTTTLSNSGSSAGYAPIIEYILPAEITYTSATFNVGNMSISPVTGPTIITDNDGGSPTTGTITNPLTHQNITLPVGTQYLLFRLPLGSFVPTQTAVKLIANGTLSSGVAINTPLVQSLQTRCGFALGSDPLDNPSTDPAVFSSFTSSTVTPTVLKAKKTATTIHGEDETATGENFPITYTIGADIANGATINAITVSETLPNNLQLKTITSVAGTGYTISFTPSTGPVQTSTSVPFTPTGAFGTGGTLSISYPSSTGTSGSPDVSLTYTSYIPDIDTSNTEIISHVSGGTTLVQNTVTVSGTYGIIPVNDTLSTPVNITGKTIATQKSVDMYTDTNSSGYTPGDTILYTLTYQISDYFTFKQLVLEDLLPDGVTYIPGSASMSFTEDGNTYNGLTFAESSVPENQVITSTPPPAHSFTACGGCTLAVTTDISDDDDSITRPDDGQTLLTFDISEALTQVGAHTTSLVGGMVGLMSVGQPTTGIITFRATINESYINGQINDRSIDTTDTLINSEKISGKLEGVAPANTFNTDSSSASLSIVAPSYIKELIGLTPVAQNLDVAPFTASTPLKIAGGDIATYRFTIDIPSGDMERISIKDFLPIPFFNANEINTTFDTSLYTPVDGNNPSVPPVGHIAYSTNTTGLSSYPAPTITKNISENSFTIDFANTTYFEKTPSTPTHIELLFSVSAQPKPMADSLGIVNMTTFALDNSSANSISSSSAVAENITKVPALTITKGAVVSDTPSAVFSPSIVGPLTFSSIGSAIPFSAAPISTQDLVTAPVQSDVTQVDAGDKIKFALIIQNTGSSKAYDIKVTDLLPTGFLTPSSPADLNLRVYSGAGVDISSQTIGGLFGHVAMGGSTDGSGDTFLTLTGTNNLLPYTNEAATLNGMLHEGENIMLLTYELTLAATVAPYQNIINSGSLTQFASAPGGDNFVDPTNAPYDDVLITVPPLTFTKSTINAPTGNVSFTPTGSSTIGEIVRYKLQVTAPEGTITTMTLNDNIPTGLRYLKDNGIVVDGNCSVTPFSGTLPTVLVTSPVGTGLATNGQDITATLSGLVTTNDNDTSNNTFCLYYDVVADTTQVAPSTKLNSATFTIGSNTTPAQTASVNILEPHLLMSKTASPTSGDAGNIVDYTLTISHRNTAPISTTSAVDISSIDILPSKLDIDLGNVLMNFASDGLDNDGDGLVDALDADETTGTFYNSTTKTFTFNKTTTNNNKFDELILGQTILLRFKAYITTTAIPSEVVTNTASINYGSIPGIPVSGIEKNGSTSGSRNLSVTTLTGTKSTQTTSDSTTGTVEVNPGNPDLAIGEQATFRITANLPEGTINNFTITDSLPQAMRVDSANIISDATSSPVPTIVYSDTNADTINDRVVLTFSTVNIPVSPSTTTTNRQIVIDVVGTVLDNVANSSGQTKTNTVSMNWTGNTGSAITASASIDIVEPALLLNKSLSSSNGDAGDTPVVTLTLAHTTNSKEDAFDAQITDVLPSGMSIQSSFGTDGIDNDNDGNIDNPEEITLAANAITGNTVTLNKTTTGNIKFDQLTHAPLSSITYRFKVLVGNSVFPGENIVNTAQAQYDSLPGNPSIQRTYSTSSSASYLVSTLTSSKTVFSTSLGDTTTSTFNVSNEDLTIGEHVHYRIAVPVPEVQMTNFKIRDSLPSGMKAIGGTLLQDHGVGHSFTAATLSDLVGSDGIEDTIDFTFGNISNPPNASVETIIVEVEAEVLNIPSTVAGANKTNTATVTYDEHTGTSAQVDVDYVEPNLSISKSSSVLSAVSGDVVTYTITLENTGTAPAYDIEIIDTPPSSILTIENSFVSDGLDNNGDGAIDEVNEGADLISGAQIIWNTSTTGNASFNKLPEGSSIIVEYKVKLQATVHPSTLVTNLVAYSASTLPGTSSSERSYTGSTSTTITVPDNSGITKNLRDANIEKQIGDTVPYRIEFTVQQGTTSNVNIHDTLPAGLVFIPSSLHITTNAPTDLSWSGTPISPLITPDSSSITSGIQELDFTFGTVVNTNTDTGSTEKLIIEYDAVVMNTADNASGNIKINNASVTYETASNKGPVQAPPITVVEPAPIFSITPTYTSGNQVTYLVTIKNTALSNAATLYNVFANLTLPSDISYSGNITLLNGPSIPSVSTGVNSVSFGYASVSSIYNNANPIQFTFTGDIALSALSGSIQIVHGTLTGTSQASGFTTIITTNPLSGERSADPLLPGGIENDYLRTASAPITVIRPDLSTSEKIIQDLNGGLLEIGDTLEYQVRIKNTGTQTATGIEVIDAIPAHLENLTITGFPLIGTDITEYAPNGIHNTGTIHFTNISVAAGSNEIITYRAKVMLDTPANFDFHNNATISPSLEGGRGGSGQTTIQAKRPALNITKSIVSPDPVRVGSSVTYSIEVTNSGEAPSRNTTLTDILPSGVTYIENSLTYNTLVQTDALDADAVDFGGTTAETLTANIGDLAVGDTITVTFKTKIEPALEGKTLINTASVTNAINDIVSSSTTKSVQFVGGSGGGYSPTPITVPSSSQTSPSTSIISTNTGATLTKENTDQTVCTVANKSFYVTPNVCFQLDSARPITFSDIIEEDSSTPYITTLKNTKIISTGDYVFSGTGNHSSGKQEAKYRTGSWEFQPERSVSRLEAVKVALISNCIPIDTILTLPQDGFRFSDLPEQSDEDETKNFAAKVFYTAYNNGVITGYADKSSRAFEPVSTAELLAITLRAAKAMPESIQQNSTEDFWAKKYLDFAEKNHLLEGTMITTSVPEVMRKDFAKLIVRVMAYNPNPSIYSYVERVDMEKQTYSPAPTLHSDTSMATAEQSTPSTQCEIPEIKSCLLHDSERSLSFSDVSQDSWMTPYIDILRTTKITDSGDYIASGQGNQSTGNEKGKYSSGTWRFEPERATTRLELLKTALVSNCIPIESTIPVPKNGFEFADLSTSTTRDNELMYFTARVFYTAYKHNIITGRAGSFASPFEPITKAEAFSILAKTAALHSQLTTPTSLPYTDVPVNSWYSPVVHFAEKKGIIGEYGEEKFHGERLVKRSEMARLIFNFMLFNNKAEIRLYAVEMMNFYKLKDFLIKTLSAVIPEKKTGSGTTITDVK